MGIAIFNRTARGVAPTEQGKEFLSYASNILSQIAEMESLYKPASPHKIHFDICVPRASYVSYAFTEFVKALDPNADIGLDYRETNSVRAIKCVSEGEHNLAIVRYQSMHEAYYLNALTERRLRYAPIWTFSYLALMSAEHPLADAPMVDFAMLQKYTEIIHGDLSVPALPMTAVQEQKKANEAKRTIAVYERGSQFELLSRIPTTYMWVSPMPQDVLDRFGLVQKRCDASRNAYRDILIARRDYHCHPIEQQFIRKLTESVLMVSANLGLPMETMEISI